MPELPEVETVRRGLERHLVGRRVVGARVPVPKMLRGTICDPAAFEECVCGRRVESVARRGKHLILSLGSGYYLLLHLNMRGQILIVWRGSDDAKYLAAGLTFDDGREMRFHDMWTWGELRLATQDELDAHPPLTQMGAEPLSEAWTPQVLTASLVRRAKTSVKAALLDQTVVAGIGNIYADESLFRSGIRPLRSAGSLTKKETFRLHRAIIAVLTEAMGGGTTSDNYADADGEIGCYRPQVYDRGGQPCILCGTTLTRIKITGRGTVYCPGCQS